MNRVGVTIVVLAYNEEQFLAGAIADIVAAAAQVPAVEPDIVIIDDGSTDATPQIAASLHAKYPFVRHVRHSRNRGFGAAFRSGLEAAKSEWITFFPGDNIVSAGTLRELLKHTGQADVVCAFPVNTECRNRFRQIVSSAYAFIYKNTFNIHLRSIHTTPLYSVQQLRALPFRSSGYSMPSEIMIKLLRQGCTFMEIPGYLNRVQDKSSALRLKNVFEVGFSYIALIYEVYFRRRAQYAHEPKRVIPSEYEFTSNQPAASS